MNDLKDNDYLLPDDTWQTQARGDNDAEYLIYKYSAQDLGWNVKTYEEWLQS